MILTRLMQNWKARTPEYLKARYGSETVEVTANRDSDPDYELNLARHRREILFGDYVDMVTTGGETNDYYLVARNEVLEHELPLHNAVVLTIPSRGRIGTRRAAVRRLDMIR